jgi:hypothetical protein
MDRLSHSRIIVVKEQFAERNRTIQERREHEQEPKKEKARRVYILAGSKRK